MSKDEAVIPYSSEIDFGEPGVFSDREKIFVTLYLGECLLNATEAARRAGIPHPNSQAYRYLSKPYIQRVIQQFLDDLAMDRAEVLARLAEMARASMSDFLVLDEDSGAMVLDFDKLLEKGHLIKSAYQTRFGWKIELHDSQKALELIGRHMSLFTDKYDMNVHHQNDDLNEALERSFRLVYGDPDPVIEVDPKLLLLEDDNGNS